MSRMLTSLLVVALLAAGGCNPYAYVNVPPQAGDVALHNPNTERVRDVEVEALRGLLAKRPLDGPVAVALPEGSSDLIHADVARRLGDDTVSILEAPETESVITISQVRIRGMRAQVDVLYPTLANTPRLLTSYLSYTPFNGWRTDRIVDWPGANHRIDHGGEILP